MHGLATLVEHGLSLDVQRFHHCVDLRVVPPLCPLAVSPADFSHTAELVSRGYASTASWLAAGCPDAAALLPRTTTAKWARGRRPADPKGGGERRRRHGPGRSGAG